MPLQVWFSTNASKYAEFDIEKELLLSLMGIETNFGTYVGKMDILSSLATLSFDERRTKDIVTVKFEVCSINYPT